jgi:hypothetical protein
MVYTRELTEEEKLFCTSLGGIVIFWNHIEDTMRGLVHACTGRGHRTTVLVAHLGNVALAEALAAVADDHDAEICAHLKHCSALFDAERIYRNYYVHNPVTFETRGAVTHGRAKHITAKGGALKMHQGQVSRQQLDEFHDRLSKLQLYLIDLVAAAIGRSDQESLSSLEKPPLPDKLELHRLRLIEQKLPPQS